MWPEPKQLGGMYVDFQYLLLTRNRKRIATPIRAEVR